METVFLKKYDDIVFRDITLPAPEWNEVRIKVDACGICGSDIIRSVDGKKDYSPFGHEVAGSVIETGSAVRNVRPGQKIVLESASACGTCDNCKNCRQELCTNVTSFFQKPYLGFAEQMLTPAISAVPYDDITPEEACLSEPLGVAIDMCRLADIRIGSHVVVSGLGPIGLMALRLAKLSGAEKIYACDLSKARIRIKTALKFGADEIIETDKKPIESYKFTVAPDRFMVSSPPRTISAMIHAAAKGAVISYIGIQYGAGADITFDANEFHFKKLQLRGSFASPAMYTPFAIRLLKNGSIDGKSLVTHVFELKDFKEALRMAVLEPDKAIKVVVINTGRKNKK